jgi:hypothetical protein
LGATFLLNVAATNQVVSSALVVDREEPGHVHKVQRPVYYTSKVPSDCKTRYNQVHKLLYIILIMKHKLLHYFDSHPIRVVTSHRLGEIVGNCITMRRTVNWALELVGLDGFHGRMDGNTTIVCPSDPRTLEHVPRWLLRP